MIGRHSSAAIALVCALLPVGAAAATLDDERLRAELDNVRALPFGHDALCERGDLRLRGSRSATFVVRASRLCALWAASRDASGHGTFVLCSTDPDNVDGSGADRAAVTRCRELDLSTFETS